MVDRKWIRRIAPGGIDMGSRVRDVIDRGAALTNGAGDTVGDAVSAAHQAMTKIEGPRLPLRGSWSIGLGQILSGHPGLPENLRGIVGHLDRVGSLRLSPDAIGFDGDVVRWDDITDITFAPALSVITAHALQHEADRLTSLLPPVPGRRWLVQQALGILSALCLDVVDPGAGDGTGVGGRSVAYTGIPVSISYRRRSRRRELTPGVFPALVAASTSGISEAIVAVAAERGIRVTVKAAPPSQQQALAIRRMAGMLSSRVGRKDNPPGIEGAGG